MYTSLTIKRNGTYLRQPFYEVYSESGAMIASGPFDHCTAIIKAYLA